MNLFEFLGVLISVIMGLGITHMLAGVSKIIHHRETVRIYWVQLVWAFSLLLQILAIWWGLFWWSSLEQWSFYQFLFIVSYAILLFLAAGMLFPWSISDDFDFERHYMHNRRWFFGMLFMCWLVDIPETLFKADSGVRDAPMMYAVFVSFMLSMCVVGAVSNNRVVQGSIAIAWPTTVIIYLGVTTLAEIAA